MILLQFEIAPQPDHEAVSHDGLPIFRLAMSRTMRSFAAGAKWRGNGILNGPEHAWCHAQPPDEQTLLYLNFRCFEVFV